MLAMAGTGLGQCWSQECKSPRWVVEPSYLSYHLTPGVCLSTRKLESGAGASHPAVVLIARVMSVRLLDGFLPPLTVRFKLRC